MCEWKHNNRADPKTAPSVRYDKNFSSWPTNCCI